MNVLIVETVRPLAELWGRAVERSGASVKLASTADAALAALATTAFDVIVLDLNLAAGGALSVADYAAYRHPEARVIFVSSGHFFSDGSIFDHITNASALLPSDTPPDDLAAVVEHHGT